MILWGEKKPQVLTDSIAKKYNAFTYILIEVKGLNKGGDSFIVIYTS